MGAEPCVKRNKKYRRKQALLLAPYFVSGTAFDFFYLSFAALAERSTERERAAQNYGSLGSSNPKIDESRICLI